MAQEPGWSQTGSLGAARVLHTATLLANGKVMVAGGLSTGVPATASAELYDPATGTWSATGNLAVARYNHVAVRLVDGRVLIAGGEGGDRRNLSSAELYDPVAGTWSPTGSLGAARELATATLLANGRVLIAGGEGPDNAVLNTAELYDPATGTWSSAGTMNAAREGHTATLLPNGRVLIASGFGGTLASATPHSSAELYDPVSGGWTATGSLGTARPFLESVLLPNGKVLSAGGSNLTSTDFNTAEIYDPATRQWSATGNMIARRQAHTLTLLATGKVLAVGNAAGQQKAELYDPSTGNWSATANLLSNVRLNHTAVLLASGKVLVCGGNGPLASAELYDSGAATIASVSAASFAPSDALAPELIAAGFGANLAAAPELASTIPLPTMLAGVSVRVRDSLGIERAAPLFFVSAGQINFLIPAGTASGLAFATVTNGGNTVAVGVVDIVNVAPGLFAANAAGRGVAAALVLRIKSDGTQSFEPVAQFDAAQNRFVAAPIDLGPETDQLFLVFYGTGIRMRSALTSVSLAIGEAPSEVLFADAAPGFIGLDQINARLSRALAGRGEVEVALAADGRAANRVSINIR